MMLPMADDPYATLMASWKQATDTYISTWNKTLESMSDLPRAGEANMEVEKNALGAQAAAREMSRQSFEPLVEMAGGVPLSEFRRLLDHVHGVHLRLDKIDDQLRDLTVEHTKKKKRAEARRASRKSPS